MKFPPCLSQPWTLPAVVWYVSCYCFIIQCCRAYHYMLVVIWKSQNMLITYILHTYITNNIYIYVYTMSMYHLIIKHPKKSQNILIFVGLCCPHSPQIYPPLHHHFIIKLVGQRKNFPASQHRCYFSMCTMCIMCM